MFKTSKTKSLRRASQDATGRKFKTSKTKRAVPPVVVCSCTRSKQARLRDDTGYKYIVASSKQARLRVMVFLFSWIMVLCSKQARLRVTSLIPRPRGRAGFKTSKTKRVNDDDPEEPRGLRSKQARLRGGIGTRGLRVFCGSSKQARLRGLEIDVIVHKCAGSKQARLRGYYASRYWARSVQNKQD